MQRIGIEYAVSVSDTEVSLLLQAVNSLIREHNAQGSSPSDTVICLKRDLEDILNE